MGRKKEEAGRMGRFVMVGAGNTAVTAVVYALLRAAGAGTGWANLLGYVVGVANGFVWSRRWVFRRRDGSFWRQGLLFLAGFIVCFGIQWVVFRVLLRAGACEYVAQLLAMCVYTGTNFLYNRRVTFR